MRRCFPVLVSAVLTLVPALLVPATASAFCGFYVGGADASLYNDATMVVMMRDGTRTVLSMQNSYQGPPENFAMVVPVPVVLAEEEVRTLPMGLFGRVDHLAAPRLVEYWEQDPCAQNFRQDRMRRMQVPSSMPMEAEVEASAADLGVTVEAEFAVGEYDIQILSANDSSGLETWLHREDYNIPDGAGDVLRPYVEAGTKFFVAKVDSQRVEMRDGRAVLSPLRFHFDEDRFSLPVRLGLLNSRGQQDLIVHILARGQRYEVANYENVAIPTNIRVSPDTQRQFASFYDTLLQRTLQAHPGAIITEYSWDASSCDPCPEPPLSAQELTLLGADVVPGPPHGFVLTRLHYRYDRDDLGEDLVFSAAPPIVGGRGTPDQRGKLQERGATESSMNNFQGRYVMLHPWEGPVSCENPNRGSWGGPPNGGQQRPTPAPNTAMLGGTVPRAQLGILVREDIPSIGVRMGEADPDPDPDPVPQAAEPGGGGCAGCATSNASGQAAGVATLLFLLALTFRRRR